MRNWSSIRVEANTNGEEKETQRIIAMGLILAIF